MALHSNYLCNYLRPIPLLLVQSHLNTQIITHKNPQFKPYPFSSSSPSSSINSSQKFEYSSMKNNLFASDDHQQQNQKILLFDIMDTIVRDPFYQDMPAFFQMTFKELIDSKHPTAWIDFELGLIDEMELARKFFKDGRPLDLEGLKNCMRRGYSYIQGVEELLRVLKQNSYEMHALTNYPIWYEMIEDKLKLSTYLSWSFCSCALGKRKPDPELYAEVARRLEVEPGNCIFIDDRMKNVEAAIEVGMLGLQFTDADKLSRDLSLLGIQTKVYKDDTVS